jgi:hypothetical protein
MYDSFRHISLFVLFPSLLKMKELGWWLATFMGITNTMKNLD